MKKETKFVFFTGKGGVGKTSLSCAHAIKEAKSGRSVLIVSTDPASNLSDVLESPVSNQEQPVSGVSNLYAINIDPEQSAHQYRTRVIDSLKSVLTKEDIIKINEQLSGACTTEIASFDEFSRFVSGEHNGTVYDVIVFDTAPTGHTLRLLELPSAWATFSRDNPQGASCLGPAEALEMSQVRYKTVVENLKNRERTTFYIVCRADESSLQEASRTSRELMDLGLTNQELLINGIFTAIDQEDPLAVMIEKQMEKRLQHIPENLKTLPTRLFPLLPYNVLGIEKLNSLLEEKMRESVVKKMLHSIGTVIHTSASTRPVLPELNRLVEDLTEKSNHGLIMTMGKGGVGKTITAAAIAVMIAQKGYDVHLTTTDPAAHVQKYLNELDLLPHCLTVDRIDPKSETQRYKEKIIAQKGKNLNDQERKLLMEDLASPCTEEVAVFHAFSRTIQQARRKFVVIDTAPTGHTLLLLDTAGAYHKEVMRNTELDPNKIKTPYMMLQDQLLSKILIVTLPETTPMREASALQSDLIRAGITPYSWVINQCFSMRKAIKDPILLYRAAAESDIIREIQNTLSKTTYGIPFFPEEHVLAALFEHLNMIPDYAHTDTENQGG